MNEDLRFGGVQRLFGPAGLARLQQAHVAVIGIGGVGSWAVEALARSGIGALTLVDLDDICVSNVNRQIHALDGSVGRPKVDVMAERVRAISPTCQVQAVHAFFTAANADEILKPGFDFVFDAIDRPANKSLLIARCRARLTPVLVAGGAGGLASATTLRIEDLARATHDRLLASVRSHLRQDHGFPRDGSPFGVECVFSTERALRPPTDGEDAAEEGKGGSLRLDCESGYGTACFVTGAFGFAAAAHMVKRLVERAGPSDDQGGVNNAR